MATASNLFVLVCFVVGASASCPSDAPGLQSFSAQFPGANDETNIVITQPTLLDAQSIDVCTIVIQGNGQLILKPGNDIRIRTQMIQIVENGQLVIGSETCRFLDNVDIALHGARTVDRAEVGDSGDKYLTVEDNGRIQMFGKDKLAWTKLTSTINMPAPEYRLSEDTTVSQDLVWQPALVMTVFDSSLTRKSSKTYAFNRGNLRFSQRIIDGMEEDLRGINDGEVVAIALQQARRATEGADASELFGTLERVSGLAEESLKLRESGEYDAFSMVFKKGSTVDQQLDERFGKEVTCARASILVNGKKVTAVSNIDTSSKSRSMSETLVLSLSDGNPTLSLAQDVSSWEIGDSVLVTSTDFTSRHAEVRKIIAIPSSSSIQLDHEFEYRHYGEIENSVDMRAEVALLSRNIKLHGEVQKECPEENENCDQYSYDTNGANIKMLFGFGSVHIEGVELYHVGQTSDKGFYPIHFHMCEDVTAKEAVIKGNSIHDSFQRAVVIHGTYGTSETALGVEVIDNVAYNILGHAYFLEDGAEKATLFRGNLVASVQKIKNGFIQTDENKPTGFWITTPEAVLVDNVASGCAGYGIWYTFPRIPVGPSMSLGIYRKNEASRTPLYTNDNNVVHSNTMGGLNFDNILLNDDGQVAGCMRYNPRVNPRDKDSDISQVNIYRFTGYKNVGFNLWLRGGGFNVQQCSLAESKRGVQLATGGPQHQYLSKCVIMGESEGNSEDIDGYPDAFNKMTKGAEAFDHYLGIVFYDGPVWISDSYLTGFKSKADGSIVAGALGFQPKNKFSSSVVSTVRNLQFGGNDFGEENWVYDGNKAEDGVNGFANFDGDESATFRDADGSVVKCANSATSGPYQIYKPEKFIQTDRTVYRSNWKMAYSTDLFGKIDVMPMREANNFNPYSQVERVNRLDATDPVYEDNDGVKSREYMAVLNRTDSYYYRFQYASGFPDAVKVTAKGVSRGQSVIVGVCLPEGTTQDNIKVSTSAAPNVFFDNTDSGIIWVDDIDTLADDSTMSRLMLKDRFLYVHLTNRLERDTNWDKFDDDHCPGGRCPSLTIDLKDGPPTTYTPCFTVSESDLNTDISVGRSEDCVMSKGAKAANWGAGDTLSSRDGNWAEWSSWSECCNGDTTSAMKTTRTRTCTAPTPYGAAGMDCAGESTQVKDCDVACPVNGAWSAWERWTDCQCMSGASGVRSRVRACDGTANGGDYCLGTSTVTGPCDGDC